MLEAALRGPGRAVHGVQERDEIRIEAVEIPRFRKEPARALQLMQAKTENGPIEEIRRACARIPPLVLCTRDLAGTHLANASHVSASALTPPFVVLNFARDTRAGGVMCCGRAPKGR